MGRVGAPWGVKGWVKLTSFASPVENILNYQNFIVVIDGEIVGLEIDIAKPQGKGLVGHIKGCDDRELAQRFTGCDLWLTKTSLPPLEEGYYWHQLEGLEVYNLQGEFFGKIDNILETGANDVIIVKPCMGSIDRNERLLPYIKGHVVVSVELEVSGAQTEKTQIAIKQNTDNHEDVEMGSPSGFGKTPSDEIDQISVGKMIVNWDSSWE
jgi:16S rRNA processing protein RimM